MNLAIASGTLSYEEAHSTIEKIVSIKARQYVKPGQSVDDVAQEIRIICFQALEKYNPAKVGRSIFHFLARCADNGLYNQQRGIYLDNNPPCLRCEHYIKETKGCAIQESGCERIVQYRDKMARRRAVLAPISYNVEEEEEEINIGFVPSPTGYLNLDEHIRSTIDPSLSGYYDQMTKEGASAVPAKIRKKIQVFVQNILGEDV